MILYLLKRAGAGFVIFLTVTGLCYVLYNIRGAEAIARSLLSTDAGLDQIRLKVVELGLDRPLIVQYVDWLGGTLTGNLGVSFASGQPVSALVATRVPVTLSLIAVSLVLTVIFSVLLGVLAASRGGAIDRVVQGLSVVLGAVPSYWLALVLVIVFALGLRWFPATGFVPITQSFWGWAATVTLPALAIALGSTLGLAVWIRSSIIDMQRRDFVRTLRSRGLSPRAIMYRHVLRNAAAPTVQILGLMIINLLGGTIIVERVFALPGIGSLALDAGQRADIPAALGAVTFLVFVIVVINLTVDAANGFLNPKVRTS